MSKYIFILFFCISSSFAQNINQYKYVEVPQRFDFQKENNVYNLNVLTKLLLEKYGFVTYMNDAIKPAEAANNNCEKVLRIKIDEESTLFVRKLTVKLLDCQNNIVYSTKQGVSSTKDLKVAYNQALRMAFESFDTLGYKYNPEASAKIVTKATDNSAKAIDINRSDASAKVESTAIELEFIAKAVESGFLLQSATLPEVRMQKSSVDNYYIAQIGDLPAMIYKVADVWKIDFYKNGLLETKVISIKF